MPGKKEIVYNGETIKVVEKEGYWELKFSNGSKEKIYLHVNAQQHRLWMWESGKIDEAARAIGELIEDLRSVE
jgi:hypothetical protein